MLDGKLWIFHYLLFYRQFAAENFGMKVGPNRMHDIVGLDLFGRERVQREEATPDKVLYTSLSRDRCLDTTISSPGFKQP